MAVQRVRKLVLVGAAALVFCWGAQAQAQDNAPKTAPGLSDSVQRQIQALGQEKAARTPAQKKVSSQFIFELKARRGELQKLGLAALRPSLQIAADDTVLVSIRATVSAQLLAEIQNLGGTVLNSYPEYDAVYARLPLDAIEQLAEHDEVRSIRPPARAFLNKINTSEGDLAHAAAAARSKYNLRGQGVKVGVLSDSVELTDLSNLQASGDLPATVNVLANPSTSATSEGTAMLEIVHDLAPSAELYFATALDTPETFATNIKALANAGCKVIVDDVGYLDESPFQDGIIAQAVNTVTAQGVLYFSAAGNFGNANDGTSGVWEGNYVAHSNPFGTQIFHSSIHNFGNGDYLNKIIQGTESECFTLFWADPLGKAVNDYDLYIVDPTGTTVKGGSDDTQDGDPQTGIDEPFEGFCVSQDMTNYNLVIAKWKGQDRFLHLSANGGRLERATAGQISGHATAVDAFAVAAVSAAGRTTPFTGVEKVEKFSTDGPRRVFYTASGAAITPGNFSATGGTVRAKPDIAAADGIKAATPGFNPFYGTSAAAPHAAAIGALMLSGKRPGKGPLTVAEVRQVFKNTALDIETPGWDRDSGYGIVRADYVLDALAPFVQMNPGILELLLK